MPRETDMQPRRLPGYLLGGRIRTSTVVLMIVFAGLLWLYESYQAPPAEPEQIPAVDVVPPGFVPDPAYTWVPRTDVMQRTPTTTTSPTSPTSPTESPASPTTPVEGSPTESTGPAPTGVTPPPPTTAEVPPPSPATPTRTAAPTSPAPEPGRAPG